MSKSKYTLGYFKLKVKRAAAGAGLGLFTTEDIPKGACIIEYFGRDLAPGEEYTSRSKYLFEINSKRTIDGTMRNNTARYINHSCRPNAEAEVIKGRVFIMAKRKIKTNEEIAYDYGKEYWDEHIKPLGCRCDKCQEKTKSKVNK
jgi:SET domain-containing protein